ncbi:MAG: inositol monophosphatase family protein [Fimbriimonadaceae bacterium]
MTDELVRLGGLLEACGLIALDERERMKVEFKADDSLVTNADKAVERYLRGELDKLAPGSTVWGEEEGYAPEGAGGLWLVDPIDGTSNYRFGQPMWGVSVGLYRNGVLELGGIMLPDLAETYLGARGQGATLNGRRLPQLAPGPIKSNELVNVETDLLIKHGQSLPGKARISGAAVIGGAFVASGRLRGLIAEGEHLYDVAASIVINREVGADVRYANGAAFDESALVKPVPIEPAWIVFPPDSGFFL